MVSPYIDGSLRKSIVKSQIADDASFLNGGLNTYNDKAFIEANQMPYVMNMTMYKPPMICTRQSRESLQQYIADTPNMGDILELFAYNDKYIMGIAKEKSDGSVTYFTLHQNNGIYNRQVFSGQPKWNRYYICYARTATDEYLYITSQYGKRRLTIDQDDPSQEEVTEYSDNYYGIPCWHKGRLFLANPETNIVTFSALDDFDNFDTTIDPNDPLNNDYSVLAGDFLVTNARGKITSLRSFDDKLYIFCEHSIHILYGDTPLTTSAERFQLVDMNNNLGTLDDRYVTVGGGNLYWFGDDCQIYEHTGSYTRMISRPTEGSHGGIDNLLDRPYEDQNRVAKLTATSDKLYVNISLKPNATINQYLFVYDIYNGVWWCEDGAFTTICNFSHDNNNILMARENGDIIRYTNLMEGHDVLFDFTSNTAKTVEIEYEFHTMVYGANDADGRKTITDIWLQAIANADVYITDIWTSRDAWNKSYADNIEDSYKHIGKLARVDRSPTLEKYNSHLYEQQKCIVEKMYGERLNTFQVIVKGSGHSRFYLMKRIWRVS